MAYHCFSVKLEACPECFKKMRPSCAVNYYFCVDCKKFFRLCLADVPKSTTENLLRIENEILEGGEINEIQKP